MESLVSKLIVVKGFYCFFATWSLIELPSHDGWSHKVGTTRDILNILIICNLLSFDTHDNMIYYMLLSNKNALKSGNSCLLGDQIRNEEAINSTRISLLKVFHFPLHRRSSIFQNIYFLHRIRRWLSVCVQIQIIARK